MALDDFIEATGERTPDVIKMDIEGAELDALRGARHTLSAHRPTLLIAVHGERLAAGCRAELGARGYRITTVRANTLLATPE